MPTTAHAPVTYTNLRDLVEAAQLVRGIEAPVVVVAHPVRACELRRTVHRYGFAGRVKVRDSTAVPEGVAYVVDPVPVGRPNRVTA
jgi:hypothetical protein